MSEQGGTVMELLECYLQAVGRQLPRRRQADIMAELRANRKAQLEDKAADLGHGLKQGEAEDWLRKLGLPMQVAFAATVSYWAGGFSGVLVRAADGAGVSAGGLCGGCGRVTGAGAAGNELGWRSSDAGSVCAVLKWRHG